MFDCIFSFAGTSLYVIKPPDFKHSVRRLSGGCIHKYSLMVYIIKTDLTYSNSRDTMKLIIFSLKGEG